MSEHPPGHDDHPETISRNARVGLWLFGVYLLLYGGFMALNAFFPQRMAAAPFGGVNLAVLYGFLLIVAAFALALLYMFLVRHALGGNGNRNNESDQAGGR
ncbi:MAG TPA: DUF485 domain-containing protein [Tepidisphaeraceae bacterium]|nr:DUF485 domain-containing protein [Tepidisphaeraceae bacterium]